MASALGRTETFLKISEQLLESAAETGLETEDTPYIRAAQQAAAQIGQLLDEAVRSGSIASADLFDSHYQAIDGTQPQIGEMIVGTQGKAWPGRIEGQKAWSWDGPNPNPYEQEHGDLIRSIREGKPLTDGRRVAEATLTAIIGRMAAYTGQTVRFQWALEESQLKLGPEGYALGDITVPPVASGNEELI